MLKMGRLAEVIFRNEENFYTVASVENDDEMEQFIAVGEMPEAHQGMIYSFEGDWSNHPSYGEQFKFRSCREEIPKTETAITAFLSSGIIKGVSIKTAEAIVSKFGDKTLEIIANEPERLETVSGIGKVKAQAIFDSYRANREFAEVSLFFEQHDISSSYAMKMYKIYGRDTISEVSKNPYRLITDIRGIGFIQADRIAANLGIPQDSEFRISSGIKYMLRRNVSDGNTYMPFRSFCNKTGEMLDVPSVDIEEASINLAIDGIVRIDTLSGERVIYPELYYEAETNVARRLYSLHKHVVRQVQADIDGLILRSETGMGIKLSDDQRLSVKIATEEGVCVITGGPGTGKTTVINTLIKVFESGGFSVALAAPTGRAAKRITETSGHEAVTIHRLLDYTFSDESDGMHFGKNSEDTLDYDVIIIDEMSMVDILLMDALTEAVVPGTRLIMVGDADQLPSVGAGNVLRDIIESEIIHTVRLTRIYRQGNNSLIADNAGRINRGEYPSYNGEIQDFFFMKRSSEQAVLSTVLELCSTRLPNYYKECNYLKDIQVLTPVHKGTLGTVNINRELQAILNPPASEKAEKKGLNNIFRVGDKVMQTKNNYRLEWKRTDDFSDGIGVFNGDIGFIREIDSENNRLDVIFDDNKRASYDFTMTDELELAYAMTIHKSQGSEFPIIVMPIAIFPPMLANRNLLYTAVTRGKQAVVLVGAENRLHAMIDNDHIEERHTGLSVWLKGFMKMENETGMDL